MSSLDTRSRQRKRAYAGAPVPTAGEVKFFEKTKVSPGSEFSLHFMKTTLPRPLRAVPSLLVPSAEAFLGSLFPTSRPPRASPPAPSRGSKTDPRESTQQPPAPRGDAAAPRSPQPRGISPPRLRDISQQAEGRPSAPRGIAVRTLRDSSQETESYPSAPQLHVGSPL